MGLFGKKVELPPPPPPTLVESIKEALKEVDVVTHLQWAAVAGLPPREPPRNVTKDLRHDRRPPSVHR